MQRSSIQQPKKIGEKQASTGPRLLESELQQADAGSSDQMAKAAPLTWYRGDCGMQAGYEGEQSQVAKPAPLTRYRHKQQQAGMQVCAGAHVLA